MAVEPRLVTVLEARLNRFEKQLAQAGIIAERQVARIEDGFAKMNPQLRFLGNFARGAIGAFTLERAIQGVSRAISDMGKVGETAARVGVTPEQLQELGFALKQSGGEFNDAGDALQKFANNIAKAKDGQSDLARFLQANNVSLRDQTGALRPLAELLGEVANLIQNAQSPQERLNIAAEFFGRNAGPAMASALENGAAGLRSFGAQAQQSGAVIENELIKKAKEIDDRWNALALTFGTTVKRAILELVDAADRLAGLSTLSAALETGTASAQQLAQAIALARSKGSPVDPSWIKDLERLQELQREANKGRFTTSLAGSTLPVVDNGGRPTNTAALNTPKGPVTDSFERAVEQTEKRIQLLKSETETLNLGTEARERARIAIELESAAKEANKAAGLANTDVTAEQRAEIDRLAASYANAAQKAEDARNPLLEFARDSADGMRMLQEVGVNSLHSLEDALIEVGKNSKDAAQHVKNFVASALTDLARLAIRQNITGPIGSFLGGLGGVPGRAAGGAVSAGNPFIVGENGPELFVPKNSGDIVPNQVVRNSVGGSSFTFAPVIDARGSDMSEARFRAILAEQEARIRQDIVPTMRQAESRRVF